RQLRQLAVQRGHAAGRFGRPLLQLVHLHRHVEELLALRFGQHHFRIPDDAERLGLDRLAVDDEAHVVVARQDERSRRAAAAAAEPTTAAAAATAGAATAAAAEAERLGRSVRGTRAAAALLSIVTAAAA